MPHPSNQTRESQWSRIDPLVCDTCAAVAVWRHPLGGLRCEHCPRPIVKRFGIYDARNGGRWWPRSFPTFEEAQKHYEFCKGPGSAGEVRELPDAR